MPSRPSIVIKVAPACQAREARRPAPGWPLVPQKIGNLLVAGRSISATHEAMGAIRVMATCMAMGEAAGRAAKISVRGNRPPADIDADQIGSGACGPCGD